MNLHQAVSLCASVVGGGVAPFLPIVGLSANWVTGCSQELKMSVDCDTGIKGQVWVNAKALLEVLSGLGPAAELRQEKGAIFVVAGKSKKKLNTHEQGPLFEGMTGGTALEFEPAPLSIAFGRVLPACDPDCSKASLRGVALDHGIAWCATSSGLHLTPLAAAMTMPTIPVSVAKAIVRAIEAGTTGIVKVRVGTNESEWQCGEVTIRGPMMAEDRPPEFATRTVDASRAKQTHKATANRKALISAVKIASLSRLDAGGKDVPPIRIESRDGVAMLTSNETAESECACVGDIAPIMVTGQQMMDALSTIDAEEVEILTAEDSLVPVFVTAGADVRMIVQVRR